MSQQFSYFRPKTHGLIHVAKNSTKTLCGRQTKLLQETTIADHVSASESGRACFNCLTARNKIVAGHTQ